MAKSTTGGQPTLTLTAGPALFQGGKQVLTVNARTGMPIRSVVTLPQVPTSVETCQVSRVTLPTSRPASSDHTRHLDSLGP